MVHVVVVIMFEGVWIVMDQFGMMSVLQIQTLQDVWLVVEQ